MNKERKVTITFSEKNKRVDVGMIAAAIAKKMREGEKNDDKRKEIS